MDPVTVEQPLELESRIRRSQGRLPRICAISTRVASDELAELESAAKREGKAIGEWSRDQLIAAVRHPKTRRRAHKNVVVVAMANKLARIAWAVLSSGNEYRPAAVPA